jgi:uncharacterized membrane protein
MKSSAKLLPAPIIAIEWDTTDKFMEYAGWLLVVLTWGFTVSCYAGLPESIPIHYNAAGEADGFGSKNFIFAQPLLSTILYAGMTWLNRYPHKFNYPNPITAENAPRQYRNATKMIRTLKLSIAVVFFYLQYSTISIAGKASADLGGWFLPLMLMVIFLPMGYWAVQAWRTK